jgi:hypothetical protein
VKHFLESRALEPAHRHRVRERFGVEPQEARAPGRRADRAAGSVE